jgi:hypothetical protein
MDEISNDQCRYVAITVLHGGCLFLSFFFVVIDEKSGRTVVTDAVTLWSHETQRSDDEIFFGFGFLEGQIVQVETYH